MEAQRTGIFNYRFFETAGFAFSWGIVFTVPLLMYRSGDTVNWSELFPVWIQFAALLIIFLLNVYVLIPHLLHKKKYLRYILVLLVFLPLFCCIELKLSDSAVKPHSPVAMPSMNKGDPIHFSSDMPPPQGYKLKTTSIATDLTSNFWLHLLVAFLVAGSAAAYKMVYYWIQEEKARKEIEERLLEETEAQPSFILVKSDYKVVKIPTDDILFVESANEYVKIYLSGGEMIMTFMRLKNMETELPKGKFMRVQRSFIVNLDKIKAIEKNKIYIVHKKVIPIGEQYKDNFQEYLGRNFVK